MVVHHKIRADVKLDTPSREQQCRGTGESPEATHRALWVTQINELYQSHGPELWSLFYSRCSDPELASDTLQESFSRLLTQDPLSVARPLSWLRRVGVNWLYDRFRRESRVRTMSLGDQELTTAQGGPAEGLFTSEMRQCVRDALEKLSEADRHVLVLKYALNWSSRQIALAVDAAPGAIHMRLTRARRALAAVLTENEEIFR